MEQAALATRAILFTDMVGSTELRVGLGEDRPTRSGEPTTRSSGGAALLAAGRRLDEVESLVTTGAAVAAEHGFAAEQRELALLVRADETGSRLSVLGQEVSRSRRSGRIRPGS